MAGNSIQGSLNEKWELVDHLIGVFGEGDTGKTTIIYHLMEQLAGLIDECTIFTRSPKSYPTIPDPYIYDGITKEGIATLETIWDRQNAHTKIGDKANDPALMRSLYKYCVQKKRPGVNEANRRLAKMKAASRKMGANITPEFKSNLDRMHSLVYKNLIRTNREWILRQDIDKDLLHVAEFVDFKYRHLLIFDDVTADLQKQKKKMVFQNLFYAARHRKITMVVIAHDDKVLDPEIRKNMHFAIFTCPTALDAFFGKTSMHVPKPTRDKAKNLAADDHTYDDFHKIIYKKKMKPIPFKRFRVPKREGENITFGGARWKEFGWAIAAAQEGSTETERAFYNDIMS